MNKKKKKTKAKKSVTKISLPASLDKTNQMLKYRFSVKHINYVTDNGIIQNGWLITDEKCFDEAIHLLKEQSAPIYILGPQGSAVIGWNSKRSAIIGGLWQNQRQIDTLRSIIGKYDDDIKQKMDEWLNIIIEND